MKNFKERRKEKQGKRGMLTLFLIALFSIQLIFALNVYGQQTVTVSGTVTDALGQPLPGATVLEEGTTNGTVTNNNGVFTINVPGNATLSISFVGMRTQRVAVNSRSQIDIRMEEETIGLDEVVAIGYGTQSRRTITTSITRVSNEKIEDVAVSSISTALQGKAAGVRVYQSEGGMPGSDATIRIRGGSSINRSNNPLIIIDGLPRTLNDININDIESIDILKDASSTAIYGARASNGVVLITTKRGKRGKAEINFNTTVGVSSPWKYMDLLDGEDYLRLTREALARAPRSHFLWERGRGVGVGNDESSPWSTRYLQEGETIPDGYKSMTDPVDQSKTIIFQDNDFQRIILRDALEQNYYLSANGGTDKILYAAGIGYTNFEGISIGTNWERFSARVNVDFYLRDNLQLKTNMDHTTGHTNTWPSQQAMFNRNLWMGPTGRVYMEDGSYAPGLNANFTNPLWYNDVHQNDSYTYKSQFGISLLWDIVKGLKARANIDYFLANSTDEHFLKANVYNSARPSTFNYGQNKNTQFEGVLTYNNTFLKNHNVNIVAGGSLITYENLNAEAEAQGGSTDKIQTLNAAPEKLEAYTYRTDEALLGYFARLTYDYNKKYLASFSLRRDESSRFAKENRVGYFPGISFGWIVSEEPFMKNSLPNTLKLRTSWGQTGNNSVGLYDAWGRYGVGFDYATDAGVFPTAMPNFSLGWETTNQFDLGIDIGLFQNDRILFIADYYTKITNNLIFNTPLPNTSGFSSILNNIGSIKYYGMDFELRTKVIDNSSFHWDIDFNISFNKNEVLSLPDNGMPQNRIGGIYNPETEIGVGGIAEGEPLGQLIGFKADFIIDNWEQANNAHYDAHALGFNPEDRTTQKGRKFPGDMEWIDKDGNSIIDDYDQFVLGYQIPHTLGGISNNLTFNNFDFKIFMDYAIGHSINDLTIRRADANALDGISRPTTNVFDAWQQEGDVASGKAKMPRFDYHDASQQRNIHRANYGTSTSTYRADFLCVREVKLGYNAPQSVTTRIGINNLYLYISGQNLYYFTKYPGFVPEFEGPDNYRDGNYPIPRKISTGLKISL
jgi:TonB-linked SusC/RagA family outer membrane protein